MNIDLLCGHNTMLDCGCTKCAYASGANTHLATCAERFNEGYASGAEAMRERAAKAAEDRGGCGCGCQAPECDDFCAERIRAIPLTEVTK